ncbi:MAG: serine hydrolase [Phenylobacterium sp.]|uniref:serine hydrolase domain-containing protein n=1 Tax=Phenylobacterium sp. TaxID=1871053 RepID=UPI003BB79818
MPFLSPRLTPLILAVALAPSLGGCGSLRPDRALAVAPALVSHQLCSAVFVAGLEPDSYFREALVPDLSFLKPLERHSIDRARGEVTASLGPFKATAVHRGAEGCLIAKGKVAAPVVLPAPAPALAPPIAGDDVVTPTDPALSAALDRAFAEPDEGPRNFTKAVVILKDGKVIAERYAPGIGPDTPLHGWSMTKSVTNALLGILVQQGRLKMDQPAPVPAWSAAADPRHAITPDSLLRMASGLKFGSSLSQTWTTAFDPTAQMVFARDDMAAMAQAAPVEAAPGAKFQYSNGNTLLLSAIIRDAAGGDGASVTRFAHAQLFDKLGMTRAVLELDAVGTPIGASHMWATARDWARFGALYADDGVVGGERILPQGWVDYSARLTPGSEAFGYGAGFWTNRGVSGLPAQRRAGMGADSFMARGSLGQFIVVVPQARLVVVRLGISHTPTEYIGQMNRLVADARMATR